MTDAGVSLSCSTGHVFPVKDGIPRFAGWEGSYADAFGLQWNIFRKTQLDSWTGIGITKDRMQRCFGKEHWDAVCSGQGTCVLEVGCGAGRFTEVLLETGAHVTSIDLSSAVDANQTNFPQDEKHRIAQADVRALPFKQQQFDFVVCLGVLQHTPQPEESIRALYAQVKPGGVLIIDHYLRSSLRYLSLKPLYRRLFLGLKPDRALRWTHRAVRTFLPLHRALNSVPVVRSIVGRISPVYHYYGILPLSEQLHREWAVLDTHDAMTDRFKHLRTREEIFNTLVALGLESIWCELGGNGVEARGQRPLAT